MTESWVCRAPSGGESGSSTTDPERALGPALQDERLLLCGACRCPVALVRDVFAPDGGPPRRVFANPAGRVFEVTCVRATWGTRALGAPELEHTWFPGFAWRVMLCGKCSSHLGWAFGAVTGQAGFAALITDKILESGE